MIEKIDKITQNILDTFREKEGMNHITGPNLPSRKSIMDLIILLESVLFPGYQENECFNSVDLSLAIGEKIIAIGKKLMVEVEKSLAFKKETPKECSKGITLEFLESLPHIRELILTDVKEAFDGDPAATSCEEIILAYPGIEAIAIHRLAHRLYTLNVPLIPRMMSELIHRRTGIDIHPGAEIGHSFFIDHGTGVVIGETTVIGNHVKVYQGVTLGALSVSKDFSNKKRHPTIEDNVTIYSGATILGGKTVIGHSSIIGGNVWVTSSISAESLVYNRTEYVLKNKKKE